jgi:phosphoribosylformylglycinamidine synthase I
MTQQRGITQPNIAIIQFPGSNCERETRMAIERVGMQADDVLWQGNQSLHDYDGFVIIGGFSYEDRCRSGLIASKDPLLERIGEQAQLGKPILGICNGAQILVESGLVPGLVDRQIGMALTVNKRMQGAHVVGTGYYNVWCHIKPMQVQPNSVFGQHFDQPIYIPIAHAEGRFVLTDEVFQALEDNGATLWQYCDEHGKVDSHFPINPNGSYRNLAAVSNAAGNVLAMMPHPERTPNGDVIFTSMRDFIRVQHAVSTQPLDITLQHATIARYRPTVNGHDLAVKMVIHDNAAVSVQKALRQMGLNVEVHRYAHWEVESRLEADLLMPQLAESYELYNPSKEYVADTVDQPNSVAYLARDHDDMTGQHKCEILQRQCGLNHIDHVHHGVIWQVVANDGDIATVDRVLRERHILFNPFAHRVYQYG